MPSYFDLIKQQERTDKEEDKANYFLQEETPPAQKQEVKPVEKPTEPQSAYERIQAGQDPFAALLQKNYQEDEASLKRQRNAEVLGNIASVLSQGALSLAGARQFKPIQNNTQAYNSALDKLRQNYNNTLANYTLQQAREDRAAELANKEAEFKFQRDAALAELKYKQEQGILSAKQAFDEAQRINKAKDAQELERLRQKGEMDRAKYNAGVRASLQDKSDKAAMERKKYEVANKGGSQSGERSIRLKYDDGTEETVTYDKSMEGAISSLYERMRQLVTKNPGKYGTSLDELKLRFEDGGDSASKIMSIVARKIGNFPELAPEFNEIIGRKQEDDKTIPLWEPEEEEQKIKLEYWSK